MFGLRIELVFRFIGKGIFSVEQQRRLGNFEIDHAKSAPPQRENDTKMGAKTLIM
jgi:hypothetical protein